MGIGADVGGRLAALRRGRTISEPMDVATPTEGWGILRGAGRGYALTKPIFTHAISFYMKLKKGGYFSCRVRK